MSTTRSEPVAEAPDRSAAAPPRSVTVVVVTFNSADVVGGLLEALPAAMEGVEEWHLVVADNASSDDTLSVVGQLAPRALVVQVGRNAGYAAGINAAVAAAPETDAVLVTNPDTRPEPGTVGRLLQVLADPGVGVVAPRLVDGTGRLMTSLRREPTITRMLAETLVGGRRAGRWGALGEVVTSAGAYEREGVAEWVSGPFLLISRSCRERVGSWDESFFLYSEETDYALRVRDAGLLTRYTPDATVVHLGGEAHVSPRLYSMLVVNRSRLYRRRHGAVAGQVFHAAVVLREASRAVRGGPTHRAALRALLSRRHRPPEVLGP